LANGPLAASLLLTIQVAFFAAPSTAVADLTFQLFHEFSGSDGSIPLAGLVQGSDGNFYGTTGYGGPGYDGTPFSGNGTVFQITTNGVLTTLYSFNGTDGSLPVAGLAEGTDGNFYGTTSDGGANLEGTIFRLTPGGTLTTLVNFDGSNGSGPGELVQGSDGNFYGTTGYGRHGTNGGGTYGFGTAFEMTTNGALTTLLSFNNTNGRFPSGLVQGTDGNFYGTTFGGGTNGSGTVFKLTPAGTLTTLFSFDRWGTNANGSSPYAALVQGKDGNFYGTAEFGGPYDNGTVFRITTNGVLTTLFSFNGSNGSFIYAGLIQGNDGNFYGTTHFGGAYGDARGDTFGTIYRFKTNGTLTTLFSFSGPDGIAPAYGRLVQGNDGNFYGTTARGGVGYDGTLRSGHGTIFRLLQPPSLKMTRVANQVVISWPTSAVGFVLEGADSLSPPVGWATVPDTPIVIGDQNTVAVAASGVSKFYRLKQQ